MKRSGPPQRKTPLARTSKIKQGKSLSREWPEATRPGWQPHVGKRTPSARKGSKSKVPESVKMAVAARSGGKCEAAAAASCRRRGSQLHHRLMRSQGGKHTVENLLDVCATCHAHIHAHPEQAYERGWLLRRPV